CCLLCINKLNLKEQLKMNLHNNLFHETREQIKSFLLSPESSDLVRNGETWSKCLMSLQRDILSIKRNTAATLTII
ncbi:hypothetical protein, partial [Bacillus sonorensis]|uniref:hypothetical protein n=1 Tax=Bacillus sonorensis TaxID=119858 RepID=UPI0020173CCE